MTTPEHEPTPMELLGRPIISDPREVIPSDQDPNTVHEQPDWVNDYPPHGIPPAPPHLNPASPGYDPALDPGQPESVTPPS